MLSRTADSLFWLARYLERADHLARLIVATRRLAALPSAYGGRHSEWESILESAGAMEDFEKAGLTADEPTTTNYLALSPDNPSSIRNCLELARTNARSVRTALTAEMWESINSGYLELRALEHGGDPAERQDKVIDLARRLSLAYEGGAVRTMLRNDTFFFSRLGLFVERADNTARLLDVKYHVLLPEKEVVGGSLDYFQWAAILRAVSANTAYHWVYRQALRPWLVADLLVLNREMPRSLIACYENVVTNLDRLARSHGKQGGAQRHARATFARLENLTLDQLFQGGLHEFLEDFTDNNSRLGALVAEQYLFGDAMRLVVRHDTTYFYAPPARQVIQRLLLTPRNCSTQHIRRWRIEVDQDCRLHEREDAFGNTAHSLSVEGSIAAITTSVEGEIETFDTQGVVQGAVERFPAELYLRQTTLTTPDAAIKALSAEISGDGGDLLTQLHALSAKLSEELTFDPKAHGPGLGASEALTKKGGGAKDLANLFVSIARGFNAPARCVSGYQQRDDGAGLEVVTHAWAEGLIPGLGWVGFDPTCGLSPDDFYIRAAIGLDSLDTAPIRGSHFGGETERMEVKVRGSASGGQSQSQS